MTYGTPGLAPTTRHVCFAEADAGRLRHARGERLTRHCHREAFAAVVLSGSYLEAGDLGKMRVTPGQVVLHGPYESHLNDVANTGAEVLVLPWTPAHIASPLGRVDDPDLLVRLCERDPSEAAAALSEQLVPIEPTVTDWLDRLAQALRTRPTLRLDRWALTEGLRPETLSRGFHRVYGVAPRTFRARGRVLRAFDMIKSGVPLACVSSDCGFSDQAHLTRDFRALTGFPPGHWRRTQRLCQVHDRPFPPG